MDKYTAIVEVGASENELNEISELLKEIGDNWDIEANYFTKSITPEPRWILILEFFLAGFFAGFLGAAGGDAYQKLKKTLKKLFDLRKRNKGNKGTILIRDTETKIICKMPMELNDEELTESLKELSKTDLKKFDQGWIFYKKEKKIWQPFDADWNINKNQK